MQQPGLSGNRGEGGPVGGALDRHIPVSVNPGKKSSKFNQDCMICRTCRWPRSDSSVLK